MHRIRARWLLRPRRLVGRDSEIRDVSESINSAPITTLLGPGGVGKTALAITGHLHGSMPLNLLAIARVAAKQGELATASKLLREALPIAQEIRDEVTARQIAELLAQTSSVEPTESATLRPEGGVWHITFNGASLHVPE